MPFSNFVDAQKYRIPPYDISLDLTWHKQFSVSDLQKMKDYENIKQTIRKGIPDNLRGQVWCELLKVELVDIHDRNYNECLNRVFGRHIPISIQPPSFGCLSFDVSSMALNEKGRKTSTLLLCILAHDFPYLEYCSFIPPLVHCLCHHMSAYDVLGCMVSMIKNESDAWNYFPINRYQVHSFVDVFSELVSRYVPKVHKHVRKLQNNESENPNYATLLSNFFIGILPLKTTFRILDCLFVEGYKIIYRICLSWLSIMQPKLLLSKDIYEFDLIMLMDAQEMFFDEQESLLFSTAYNFNISRTLIDQIRQKTKRNSMPTSSAVESHAFFRPLPHLSKSSACVDADNWMHLWKWVPARFRLLNLDLVFTTREHGHNLNTLYEKCGDEEPLLLIVETLEGHVFGAFLTTAMSQRDSKKYHGQGEVFVFSLKPKAAQYKWCIKEDEDADSSFIMGAIDYFSVGAGGEGNAIWLNYDLTMTASSRSATFENEPLCGESKRTFQVGGVEVYRFTDG